MSSDFLVLDCTLRDGGYYNDWNFPSEVVADYISAMVAAKVDIVELGLRSLKVAGFSGASAYTTDSYVESLKVPEALKVAVMVNASELVGSKSIEETLEKLFPNSADNSPVSLVRIACHVHEFEAALPASKWLKNQGYEVGFNLMQVADRSESEVVALSRAASTYDLDALYFADSMGSMTPSQCRKIIGWLQTHWSGAIGIHTHDNMGLALQNTLEALDCGVTWLDSTVTGMGRGPGNARTEELVIEISELKGEKINLVPLMSLIQSYFQPLKNKCGWGSNPYYFLSGKYGIHPTYIQEMLADSRYSEEDILAVIEHLRVEGGKKFSFNALDSARHFYKGASKGTWSAKAALEGREVLLLGTGPGVYEHRKAIEQFILKKKPVVISLNTQSAVQAELIDYRVACHPVRLLADCETHTKLPQPLITPYSMLPEDVRLALGDKEVLDFGLEVSKDTFEFGDSHCVVPTSLVMAYAFAIIASGKAGAMYLAGFDGYGADDPRNIEMNRIVHQFKATTNDIPMVAITPSRYDVEKSSVYGI